MRVFTSGKRSYVIQYGARGRSRRYTIGPHGVWTPETARREEKAELRRVAQDQKPAEECELDAKALTLKQLCREYVTDIQAGLILGKDGQPKKASTIEVDTGRIRRDITPLVDNRCVQGITKADVNDLMRDIIAGKMRLSVKTEKLPGRAIVPGGPGTAIRRIGLLRSSFIYAVQRGFFENKPTHDLKKPQYRVRDWRLSEAEYRKLGELRDVRARIHVKRSAPTFCTSLR